MTITKREIVKCLIFSLITCGIYGLYWLVKLNDEVNILTQEPKPTSGVMVIVLTLVTCGIYGYYWYYKMGEKVDALKVRRGQPASSSPILFLILGFVGLAIVNYCLIQDEINKTIDPLA